MTSSFEIVKGFMQGEKLSEEYLREIRWFGISSM